MLYINFLALNSTVFSPVLTPRVGGFTADQIILQPYSNPLYFHTLQQKESEKRNVTVQADDPISFMQLTAKNEMTSKEDQFQLSLLAAMGNTQRKEAADPLASKLNKVHPLKSSLSPRKTFGITQTKRLFLTTDC